MERKTVPQSLFLTLAQFKGELGDFTLVWLANTTIGTEKWDWGNERINCEPQMLFMIVNVWIMGLKITDN